MIEKKDLATQAAFSSTDGSQRSHHLKSLRRRLEYVGRQIEQGERGGAGAYLRAERAALQWALDSLDAPRETKTRPLYCWPDGVQS